MASPPKRSKSFTGCFTCRSRKIRCGLERPTCYNCEKSSLECLGYDIKLKWSRPLSFKQTKKGHIQAAVSFKEEDANEFFQRRSVASVRWKRPYATYDEMDRDLMVLHNSSRDTLVDEGSTKLLGPFGVFKGRSEGKEVVKLETPERIKQQERKREPERIREQKRAGDQGRISEQERIREPEGIREGTDTHRETDDPHREMRNPPRGVDRIVEKPGVDGIHERLPEIDQPLWYMDQPYEPQADQVWLSNELRDDALLTAAALNGDSQFLELMSRYSMSPTDKHADLLNLVFHKNDQPIQGEPIQTQAHAPGEDLAIHLHAASGPIEDDSTDLVEGQQSTQMPESIMRIVQTPLHVGCDLSVSRFSVPSSALQVQPLARYLLNYYVAEVADLMTVIPLTENPWKTIYVPRALMAIGELAALGSTSPAKNALLNALLAVSAFNLQSKFPKNSDAMRYYLNLGIRLRNQASLFVRQLLHAGAEHCVRNEKYKDVLCAVMSMISVDLVWGTMQDTNFYIAWCGKVIGAKMRTKRKLSSKARVLHRIFSSMKLIQDSTCLDVDHVGDVVEVAKGFDTGIGYTTINSNGIGGDSGTNIKPLAGPEDTGKRAVWEKRSSGSSRTGSSSIGNAFSGTGNTFSSGSEDTRTREGPTFLNKKLINTKKDEHFATDALYGLPNSLIVLFSETVQLLRTKIYHQETYHKLPDDFTKRVNDLNKRLLNWHLDWNLCSDPIDPPVDVDVDPDLTGNAVPDRIPRAFYSPMHETTYHHTYSFYHALMIYFNRLIKEIAPARLQIKVTKTLSHLNAIQQLIAQGNAAIIPLFWQGFIAGCEATSEELQQGFKSWGADIAQYLGSYWGARQIMLEVWRRKRMNEARDDWVSVIRDWEMNLMLN